ncbi:MAG: hypothetical protein KGJ86_12440, partial [Chloroflexota bacterium]|nr:hypothetical protein [Chloroflexota bacterium]
MATPSTYLALPSALRSTCLASLRSAGFEVAGVADTVADARRDPAFVSAGVLLYDASRSTADEVDAAVRQPYDGAPLRDGRIVIAALEPTDGPPIPIPGVEQRFLFLPPSDDGVWARTLRNALTATSYDPFRVVATASPYGAAGKTTITLNLGVTLQCSLGISTIVLDCASEGPLLRYLLPEPCPTSILDVAQSYRRQPSSLADALQRNVALAGPYHGQVLRVLCAPPLAEDFSRADDDGRLYLDTEFHRELIKFAKQQADIVLIDSSQDRWQP